MNLANDLNAPAAVGRLARWMRSRYGSLYLLAAVFFTVMVLLRVGLLVHSFGQADHHPLVLLKVFAVGLVFDVATYFYFALPGALLLLILPDRLLRSRAFVALGLFVYFWAIYLILFDATAEWLFWDSFGTRFNFISIDYLRYPKEVVGNMAESYPVKTILAVLFVLSGAIVLATRRGVLRSYRSANPIGRRWRAGLVFLLAPCVALAALRPTLAAVSDNEIDNELAQCGPYCFVQAWGEANVNYEDYYLTAEPVETFTRLRALLATPNSRYLSNDPFDIARRVTPAGPARRMNVIILVEESLDADFLGVFGNRRGLTPCLDALARESLVFYNFYAPGSRTIRGLEAVTTGLPPTLGEALPKREDRQPLPTLARALAPCGYDAKFVYGGNADFDAMAGFFSANGYQVVDRKDMAGSLTSFANAWGVCDEDLYAAVLREGDRSFAQGRPFLVEAMTMSNHKPFTYPQKIDIPSGSGRDGAVKYADYAIGQFIAQLRARPWAKDTIVAIVADHCAESSLQFSVTVARHHIPLYLYAPGLIAPGVNQTLCCQSDIAPTLLGLLNVSYTSRFFGRDMLTYPRDRAWLAAPKIAGLLQDDRLTLLSPGRKSSAFRVAADRSQQPAPPDPALLGEAVTYYQAAGYLLEHRRLWPPPAVASPGPFE